MKSSVHAYTKSRPILLALIYVIAVSFGNRSIAESAASCTPDQSQTAASLSFWFDHNAVRWQEFQPSSDVLCRIDLCIRKAGDAGDIVIKVADSHEFILWQGKIKETEVVDGWNTVPVSPAVGLTVGDRHTIHLRTNRESPDSSHRYYWWGLTDSPYAAGASDVEAGWPGFDYAFRTHSDISTALPRVTFQPDAGSYRIGDRMIINKWMLANGSHSRTAFDLRMWIRLPDGTCMPIFKLKDLTLPSGGSYDFAPVGGLPFIEFSPGLPPGEWEIGSLLNDAQTGGSLNATISRFELTSGGKPRTGQAGIEAARGHENVNWPAIAQKVYSSLRFVGFPPWSLQDLEAFPITRLAAIAVSR